MAKEYKKIDFDSSLKELESIVEKLEDEDINLEDSVKSFEKGISLVKGFLSLIALLKGFSSWSKCCASN